MLLCRDNITTWLASCCSPRYTSDIGATLYTSMCVIKATLLRRIDQSSGYSADVNTRLGYRGSIVAAEPGVSPTRLDGLHRRYRIYCGTDVLIYHCSLASIVAAQPGLSATLLALMLPGMYVSSRPVVHYTLLTSTLPCILACLGSSLIMAILL